MKQWSEGDFGPYQSQKRLPFVVGEDGSSKAFAKRNIQQNTELNILASDGRCKDGADKRPISGAHFVLVNGQKVILLSACQSAGVRHYHPEGSGSSYELTQAFLDSKSISLVEVGADAGWPILDVRFTGSGFRKAFYDYNRRSANFASP